MEALVFDLLCYLIAVILLVLAAFRVTTRPVELAWLGLAFAVLPHLVNAFLDAGARF
jgi:hypothetical protein